MEKRAISTVVATVLIILITVAGVTIIWAAIVPMIKEKIIVEGLTADLNIETIGGYTVWDSTSEEVTIQVKRGNDDEDLIGIQFIITKDGNSEEMVSYDFPEPNQAKLYEFNAVAIIGGEPDSIKIAPIFGGGVSQVTSEIENLPGGTTVGVDGIVLELGDPALDVCDGVDSCDGDGGDGCCPSGCNIEDDGDCDSTCSDEVLGPEEVEVDCGGVCTSGTETLCTGGLDEDNDCLVDCLDIVDCSADSACVVPSGTAITSCPYTISAPGEYYLANDCNCALEKCIIITEKGDNVIFNGNGKTLSSIDFGVYIWGTSVDKVVDVEIYNINFEVIPADGNAVGIYIFYATNFSVHDNSFDMNGGVDGYKYGVRSKVSDGIGSLIKDNNIIRSQGNDWGTGIIIDTGSSPPPRVNGNLIVGMNRGIHDSAGGTIIENNSISNYGEAGIYLGNFGETLRNNSVCAGASGSTFSVNAASGCGITFDDNTCTDSNCVGLCETICS